MGFNTNIKACFFYTRGWVLMQPLVLEAGVCSGNILRRRTFLLIRLLSVELTNSSNCSQRSFKDNYLMNKSYFESLQIVQNAYFVQDLDNAIKRWHTAFGLGPFIVSRHLKLDRSFYRGAPMPLDISTAFVQSGDLQIELLCQHNPEPSAFHDMFAQGEEGLHHVAVFPDDYDQVISAYKARGFDVASEIMVGEGLGAAFIDTRELLGHMLEVYRVNDDLRAFYRLVADAARDWDGRTLIMDISESSS
jgi:hypothetical protein